MDVVSNDVFIQFNEWGGYLAGMASEEMAEPYQIPDRYPRGKYLLLFDPLDGSSNIDVNVAVGSIFSVIRAPNSGVAQRVPGDAQQPGRLSLVSVRLFQRAGQQAALVVFEREAVAGRLVPEDTGNAIPCWSGPR